ncbi:MAG: branched-chain amino acid ABC transporter permease [Paracoccaceae bacterium]|jgi:branched-chain amino acid transport system permease protein
MLFRTGGQFKTSYKEDIALFPVRQDAILLGVVLVLAWIVFPLTASEFVFQTLLIPILIYALAALGLNLLIGYTGQFSLGTGAFMGVGAFACYKMVTLMPWMNPIVAVLLSGVFSAGVGVVFGIPSLRIKGFYLAISTLAAQFFLVWIFEKWSWLYNDNLSGAIEVPNLTAFGVVVTAPRADSVMTYYVILAIATLITWLVMNLTRGALGRSWKATRDMDFAAELIGINLMKSKLTAFALSSYIVGVAGALFVFMWRGAAEPALFDIPLSFRILYIVIIGGLGSIMGNYLGAVLIVGLPVILGTVPEALGLEIASARIEQINLMIIGALIVFFLIVEPHGLARLWELIREKLIRWPFPH